MSASLRLLGAWLVFGSVYVLLITLDLPRPRYLPELGRLSLEVPSGVIAMGWYGAVLVAGGFGLLGGWLLARVPLRLAPGAERRLTRAGLVLLLLQLVGLVWFELRAL